jgi:hypothetical protein
MLLQSISMKNLSSRYQWNAKRPHLLERNIDLIVDVLLCIAMDVHIITGVVRNEVRILLSQFLVLKIGHVFDRGASWFLATGSGGLDILVSRLLVCHELGGAHNLLLNLFLSPLLGTTCETLKNLGRKLSSSLKNFQPEVPGRSGGSIGCSHRYYRPHHGSMVSSQIRANGAIFNSKHSSQPRSSRGTPYM